MNEACLLFEKMSYAACALFRSIACYCTGKRVRKCVSLCRLPATSLPIGEDVRMAWNVLQVVAKVTMRSTSSVDFQVHVVREAISNRPRWSSPTCMCVFGVLDKVELEHTAVALAIRICVPPLCMFRWKPE